MANIKVVQPTSVEVAADGTLTSISMLNIATSASVVAMASGESVEKRIETIETNVAGKAEKNHEHVVADITDFPTTMKNPNALNINGTTYDGSEAVNLSLAVASHTHNYAGSASVGGAANSVANALTISLNGESQGAFDGSAAKTIDITPESIGASAEGHTHSSDELTGTIPASMIDGVLSIDNIPAAAVERLSIVADEDAMLALTSETLQAGDTVKIKSTGKMYYVKDASKLGSMDAFEEYTVGSAASVPWTGVTGKPETFTPSAHTHVVADITDFPASLKNPYALTISLNGESQGDYDGSAVKAIDITAASVGAYSKDEIDQKVTDLESAVTNSKLAAWPIGSVFTGIDSTIDPTTLLGGGTWAAIGELPGVVGETTYLMKLWQRTA